MDAALADTLRKIEELTRAEDFKTAIQVADEFLTSRPTEARAWRARGHLHALQGNYDVAIVDLSHAIELRATELDYFFTRGRFLFACGMYFEAIQDFSRTLELGEEQQSELFREAAYFFRADAYARLKLRDKAVADCEKIRDNAPMWIDSLRCKADILSDCL